MEKLYLKGFNLNAARILDRLIDVVAARGGKLVDVWPFVKVERGCIIKNENKPGAPEETLRARSYLNFVLNGTFYYVQLGQNPFLDCILVKEKIGTDGNITAAAEGAELPLDWWYLGESEYTYLNDDEIVKLAESLCDYVERYEYTQKKPGNIRKTIREVA